MTARRLAVPLGIAAAVTALVTLASAFLPDRYVATVVGLIFFGATWLFVWRGEDDSVVHHGLSFGGAVTRGQVDVRRLVREVRIALGWAFGLAVVTFGPFFVGWRLWARYVWHSHHRFVFAAAPLDVLNEIAGQLVIIALPEEAFYRGFLQTRLEDLWPGGVRVLGANVGPAILVTSAIFALGHLATQHDASRLAVFFPSILFGWLRARTRGIGAGLLFHAMCNLFSETLMRGYGLHG